MSDRLLILRAEDFRIEAKEVRAGPYSYMKGHPPFLTASTRALAMNFGISKIRRERTRFLEEPSRPYIFSVDEVVDITPDGLDLTTPTPGLRVMCAHASMLENGLWIFADGIPVVEGVRAYNQAYSQEPVNLVVACQEEWVDPMSVDVSPFRSDEGVMSVYAGTANAGFGLTDSGIVVCFIKVAQFPDMRPYLASLPTFKP